MFDGRGTGCRLELGQLTFGCNRLELPLFEGGENFFFFDINRWHLELLLLALRLIRGVGSQRVEIRAARPPRSAC